MKHTLKIMTFFLFVNLTISQVKLSENYKYSVSNSYKEFEANGEFYFSKENEVMSIKIDNHNIFIQKFDAIKPKQIKEKLYEKFLPKNCVIEHVLEINSKYYIFYSSWDGDLKREQLFALNVSFEKGEIEGDAKLVFYNEGKVRGKSPKYIINNGFNYSQAFNLSKFELYRSMDKKRVLIEYEKISEKKNNNKNIDVIYYKSINENLEVDDSYEFKMPYTETKMDILDFQIDKNGNIYKLVKVFNDNSEKDRKSKNDDTPNSHLEIFFVKKGSNEIKISKFDEKNLFFDNLIIIDTPFDYVLCGGLYLRGKGKSNEYDGLMSFKIDSNGNYFDKNFIDIPADIINLFESESENEKNKKKEANGEKPRIKDFILKGIHISKDGSYVINIEQLIIKERSTTKSTTYTYFYNDIITSKISANGKLEWMKKIPKYQQSYRGTDGLSFKYLNVNSNHYIIYLDNVKNLNLPLDKTPEKHTNKMGGYLTAVKISDIDGSMTKEALINLRNVNEFQLDQFSPYKVFKVNDNIFMFEANKKNKEDVMIKIEIK